MADTYFAISLGESFTTVADIKPGKAEFEAVHLGIIPTDPIFFKGDSEKMLEKHAGEIAKLLSRLKVTKKNVNIIIPDTYSYNQFIEMPHLNEKELLSAIKYQADQFIPMPLAEINLDIETVHENEKEKKLLTLISAAPKKVIEKAEKTIEYAGLVPNNIETEMSAAGRIIAQLMKGLDQNAIFINLGLSSTSLYFYDKSLNLVTFTHNFGSGFSLFLKEIQVNLNVEPKKAYELLRTFGAAENASYRLDTILSPAIKDFLNEVARSIQLLSEKNKVQVSSMYLFNDALQFHSFETIVGKYFGIPATILSLLPHFKKTQALSSYESITGFFVTAVGGNLR